MKHTVHGQHEGREERIRQTQTWLGATPVDCQGQPAVIPPKEAAWQRASEICDQIRTSLASGIAQVQISETDADVIDQIKQQLGDDELQRVQFG